MNEISVETVQAAQMTKKAHPESATVEGIRIGMAAKLAGMPAETIRVWERRYGVVEPMRLESGERVYTQADVVRLSLLRAAVDRGAAIGVISKLSTAELGVFTERYSGIGAVGRGNLWLAGEALEQRLAPAATGMVPDVNIAGSWPSLEALQGSERVRPGDIILAEVSTLVESHAVQFREIADSLQPRLLVIVYNVAARKLLGQLQEPNIILLRGPVEPLQLLKVPLLGWSAAAGRELKGNNLREQLINEPPPEMLFSPKDLGDVAALSGATDCEYPFHVAELIGIVRAFEAYAGECHEGDPRHQDIHQFLRRSASHARAIFEEALRKVVQSAVEQPEHAQRT